MRGYHHTPEARKKISESRMGKYSGENSPNFRKHPSIETRKKMSDSGKKKVFSIEHRKNMSESVKGKKNHFFGKHHSYESRKKISEALEGEKSYWFGKNGENHPCWLGGISFEPYTSEFNNVIKRQIKERDSYTCQNPNCNHTSNILCVHHIDYNKKKCHPSNLITLCNSCNSRANFDRPFWKVFLRKTVGVI